jgi:hypothetical protein
MRRRNTDPLVKIAHVAKKGAEVGSGSFTSRYDVCVTSATRGISGKSASNTGLD